MLLLTGACDSDVDARHEVLTDSSKHAARIGTGPGNDPDALLARVLSARMTEGGEHVVVLEGVPPFVKVFDRDGTLRASFVEPGGGPGEMRNPIALAVSGDSAIFVADAAGGSTVFTLDGERRAEIPALGFPVLAAAAGCADTWTIYGPKRERGTRRARWLHHVRPAPGGAEVTSVFEDTLAAARLAAGVTYGAARLPGPTILVRHVLGPEPGVLAWNCGDADARLLRSREAPAPDGSARPSPDRMRLETGPGARALGGIASVADGYAVADRVFGARGEQTFTEITLTRDGTVQRIRVPGDYVLWDGAPGVGVLVGTNDPVPQVFLVREAEFLSMF